MSDDVKKKFSPLLAIGVALGLAVLAAVVAFVVGLLAVKACLKLVKNGKLYLFSIYTLLLSIASFCILFS